MYQKPNKRLFGQTAIITGASSGIGKAVAQSIGREGANIVVNYASNAEAAEELGITSGAASKRYIRALERLQGIVDETPGLSWNG